MAHISNLLALPSHESPAAVLSGLKRESSTKPSHEMLYSNFLVNVLEHEVEPVVNELKLLVLSAHRGEEANSSLLIRHAIV